MTPLSTMVSDVLDPARAQALQAALGLSMPLTFGDSLPPFFHQIYFWTALPPDQLGRDGHPARGVGVVPDLGLPRRMWAGGRLHFHAPLLLGSEANCTTTCLKAVRKTGRSGPLGLVTLQLQFFHNEMLCLTEERDLIYREDHDPNAPRPVAKPAPGVSDTTRDLSFSSTLLFRYSALTFNGHRIHYDLDYATGTEGYGGLVVHGPLLAQHLMLLAQDTLGPLGSFEFRATAPLVHTDTAQACQCGQDLWIRGPDGQLCMTAKATPAR